MTDTYIENRQTLRVTPLLLQEALKYSSAQWQFTDVKTITEDTLARAQRTRMKRSDDILVIIPQFDTEDLPHLVVEFIENIRVIGLIMTILHTTDIRNVTKIPLLIVQCPRELARTKLVYETVEIPLATRPARNYRKRKLFAKHRRRPHLLLRTFRRLSLRCPTIISSPSNKLVRPYSQRLRPRTKFTVPQWMKFLIWKLRLRSCAIACRDWRRNWWTLTNHFACRASNCRVDPML